MTQAGVKVTRIRRLEDGQLAEPSGQQHFDFEAQAEPPKPPMPCTREPWRLGF